MKTRTKRLLYTLAALVVVVMAALTGGGFFMLNHALRPTMNFGKDVPGSYAKIRKDYPWITPWLDSLTTAGALRDTFIVNPEGIRLHALYARADRPTPETAVIVHGYTDNCVIMLMIGYLYHRQLGYNILLPDLQNSGESGGEAIQMGWKDRLDVMQWMQVANETFGGETQMVVHGISMGAATTMMVSGETLPAYVRCFVEDCGYTSVWDQFSKELKEQFNLPPFPLLYTTDLLCRLRYGWGFREASALEQVEKCRLPMLFIHGDSDRYVPTWMFHPLFESKPQPKEGWVVPGATHAQSYKMYPEEYTARVKQFTNQYMNNQQPMSNETQLKIETTLGDIAVKLYDDTPLHRDNFIKLAQAGTYEGTLFHRVIRDFMIQAGDPDSKNAPAGAMLGSGDVGYTIPAEIVYPKHFHHKGVLAAARQGDAVNPAKASSGCQFYIVTGTVFDLSTLMNMETRMGHPFTDEQLEAYTTVGGTPHLDGAYTVFGEVTSGMEVVDSIQHVRTDGRDRPQQDVKIVKVSLME